MKTPAPLPPLRLAEVLDLTAAAPLAAELLARRGRPVNLDAGEVRRLGGLCLQVLLSVRTSWEADGVAFDITDPSPAFSDALAKFGAQPFLPGQEASL